jgi:hypothetical protein
MFATPVASRTLKGSSNGTERAFRHSPYRNVRGEAGIAGPHLIALLGQSPMIVLHLGQIAVAPFDRRRSTLKDIDPLGRPCLPIRKDLRSQPLGCVFRLGLRRGKMLGSTPLSLSSLSNTRVNLVSLSQIRYLLAGGTGQTDPPTVGHPVADKRQWDGGSARHLHTPCRQLQDHEHGVWYQAMLCHDLHGEEVCRCQHFPVEREELCSAQACLAARPWARDGADMVRRCAAP